MKAIVFGGIKQKHVFLIMVFPLVFILAALTIFPLLFCLYASFHAWVLYTPESRPFVGLRNYIYILGNKPILSSIRTTILFTLATVTLQLVLGLGIALILSSDFKGKQVIRSVLLAPMMTTPAVVGLVWRLMYNPELGIINYYLRQLFKLSYSNWLGGQLAFASVVVVDVWEWTPFVALILMSAIAALPKEPYEAAIVDGANTRQIFFSITLYLLRPALLISVLFRVIDSIRVFDLIYVLTQGGPGIITTTVSLYIYRYSFKFSQIGLGAAFSIVVLIVVIIISQFLIKVIGREAK